MTRRLTAEEIWPEDYQVLPRRERLPILRRLLPESRKGICELRPDLWPDDRTGHRRLERDLDRMEARFGHGLWWPPEPAGPHVEVIEGRTDDSGDEPAQDEEEARC